MKIAVTSDLHGYLPDIEPCEVLFICGDISPLDIQSNIPKMQVWLRNKFASWINNLPCNQVLMVAGNHDFIFQWLTEHPEEMDFYIGKPTKYKLGVLDGQECNINSEEGPVYKVWGSPYCKIFYDWAFMVNDETLQIKYSTIPKGCDIVITHDAPKVGKYGTVLEGNYKNTEAGNKILAKAIQDKMPRFHFFGHIHSGNHKLGKVKNYGKTQFANVSYVNESYLPTNEILYLDI